MNTEVTTETEASVEHKLKGAAPAFTEADLKPAATPEPPAEKPPVVEVQVPTDKPKAKKAKTPKAAKAAEKKAKTPKAAKAAEKKAKTPKAASKAKRILVYELPVTSVIRRLAKNGFKFPEIKRALAKKGAKPADTTIRVFMSAGKAGTRGEPAHLTREQLSEIRTLSKAEVVPAEKPAEASTEAAS